jgi:uncharacterized membrane protein YqhA
MIAKAIGINDLSKVFDYSRYLAPRAVIGLQLAAMAVFVFAGIATVSVIVEAFEKGGYSAVWACVLSVEIIEMIDLFLLGTILLITSLGLYQLFIRSDMEMPECLIVANLEQFNFKLLAVIVVMLAILFLGEAAGTLVRIDDILQYGLAIAAVAAAVALAVWVFQRVVSEEAENIHETLLKIKEQTLDEHVDQ